MEVFKNINWIDVFVIIILIKCTYSGVKDGLTAEIFKLIGTILSLVFAIHFYKKSSLFLSEYIPIPVWIVQFVLYIFIIFCTRTLIKYTFVLLLKILNIEFISQLEKIGGAAIGLGRGVLVAGVFLFGFLILPVSYLHGSIRDSSYIAPFCLRAVERAYISSMRIVTGEEPDKEQFSPPAVEEKN